MTRLSVSRRETLLAVSDLDELSRRAGQNGHDRAQHTLSNLSKNSDKEFKRFAILEAKNSPLKYLRSLIIKLKVFMPYRYFPSGNNSIIKDAAYVVPYSLSLVFFLWSIIKYREFTFENKILLIALIGMVIPGLIYFMLSRHLYPPIVLMLIFSFISYSNTSRKLNKSK